MTDPILTAARELFERVGWLYQASDPKCTEEGVRALHAFALRQRAEGAREGCEDLRLFGRGPIPQNEMHVRLTGVAARLEAQAKEIEGQ